MQIATPQLLEQLLQVARLLPNDQLTEVVDFAGYLRQRQASSEQSARGSAAALLPHVGTLHFAPGELDCLLTDLADLRALDQERPRKLADC
jgi:hypothetical protein